jgi:hypothetical protein
MTTKLTDGATPRLVLADPTIGFRRRSAALALPAAFACELVSNALYAVSAGGGIADNGTGTQTLEFYAAHVPMMTASNVFALVGVLLAVPGVLAALRVLRPTKPRLGLIAAVLMVAGYICYFGTVTTIAETIALAQGHVAAGAALDAVQANPVVVVFWDLFVVGNLLGTLLLGLAVILSRELPWYAGALILGWPVGHIINITGGGEWFAVAGGALEVIGLVVVATHALRLSNAEWAARG